jgi:glycosyltransferase involved in cell wall biosynthesis
MARGGRFRLVRRLRGELAAWRQVDRHLKELYRYVAELNEFRERLEPQAQIPAVMAWIAEAELRTEPLVSVVMPTLNRGAVLPRAVRSVIAQGYSNWELLVVDDGDVEATAALLAPFADDRIRLLAGRQAGESGGRNVALDAAKGELIAYLDTDNVMHPGWLKSVVWAFEQRPDLNVLYGAIVIDDPLRVRSEGEGGLPTAYLRPFDREALTEANLADMSAIAHRAGLAEARHDERLDHSPDWDLLLRLTAEEDALALPVLACFYLTDVADRLSRRASAKPEWAMHRPPTPGPDRYVPPTGAKGG